MRGALAHGVGSRPLILALRGGAHQWAESIVRVRDGAG